MALWVGTGKYILWGEAMLTAVPSLVLDTMGKKM